MSGLGVHFPNTHSENALPVMVYPGSQENMMKDSLCLTNDTLFCSCPIELLHSVNKLHSAILGKQKGTELTTVVLLLLAFQEMKEIGMKNQLR